MKALPTLKRMGLTATVTFTVFVYALYLLAACIPTEHGTIAATYLSVAYLNGFFLFGALLGLTNAWLDSTKLKQGFRRLWHFIITLVNFLVSVMLLSGNFSNSAQGNTALTLPKQIFYTLLLFTVLYWICIAVRACFKKLLGLGKKDTGYQSVLSKRS